MKTDINKPDEIYIAEKGTENFKPVKVSKVELTSPSKKLKDKPKGKSVFSIKLDKETAEALWKVQNQALREQILMEAQRNT